MIQGAFADDTTKGVLAKMEELGLNSDDNPNHLGVLVDVYGGGNEATVYGNTTVNIGTEESVHLTSTDENPTVKGAFVSSNVYGGGNAADVTGSTNVVIGQ